MKNYCICEKDLCDLNGGFWTLENNPKVVDLVSFVPLHVRATQILLASDRREQEMMFQRSQALYYDSVDDETFDVPDSVYDAKDFAEMRDLEKRAESAQNALESVQQTKSTKNTSKSNLASQTSNSECFEANSKEVKETE